MWYDLKKLDSFALETSKTHLIRNFLRNGLVKVNLINIQKDRRELFGTTIEISFRNFNKNFLIKLIQG